MLLTTLGTHLINEEGYSALRANDFDGFVAARREAVLTAIRSRV